MKLRFLSQCLVAVLLVLGAVLPFSVSAVSSSSILVRVSPENPSPGENTTITLSSYATNLDNALISWFVNGKSDVSEIGKKSFEITAPASGGETTVRVKIKLSDGEIEKTVSIRPAFITLLWQAGDSYVPPFYRGKALPTADSQIKIIALPEVKSGSQNINPKNMIYAWRQDYSNMQDESGYGKNSFTYIDDYLENSSNISVVASTVDQKYSSEASIEVRATDAKILFYRDDPNLGTIWEHALRDGHKIEGGATIEAAPYFISPADIRIPILTWVWSINNNGIETVGSRKNILPIKVQEGTSGTSIIKLDIENKYRIFGAVSGKINVTF